MMMSIEQISGDPLISQKALQLYQGEKIPDTKEVLYELDLMSGKCSSLHQAEDRTFPLSDRHKFLLGIWVGSLEEIQDSLQERRDQDLLRQALWIAVHTRDKDIQKLLTDAMEAQRTPEEKKVFREMCEYLTTHCDKSFITQCAQYLQGPTDHTLFSTGLGDNSKS